MSLRIIKHRVALTIVLMSLCIDALSVRIVYWCLFALSLCQFVILSLCRYVSSYCLDVALSVRIVLMLLCIVALSVCIVLMSLCQFVWALCCFVLSNCQFVLCWCRMPVRVFLMSLCQSVLSWCRYVSSYGLGVALHCRIVSSCCSDVLIYISFDIWQYESTVKNAIRQWTMKFWMLLHIRRAFLRNVERRFAL